MIATILAAACAVLAAVSAVLAKRVAAGAEELSKSSYASQRDIEEERSIARGFSVTWKALLAATAVALAAGCVYAQDVGEVAVLRNWGGSLAGHSEDAGFHLKAPWQDVVTYDTRNNLVNMYRDSDYTYDGGSATGAEVTVNDSSGASADVDVQVIYSLDPSTAEYLYTEYGDQTTFTQNYILNDFRSVVRECAGKFDTVTMLTDRSQYTKAITSALTEKWEGIGLTVEQVNVQDIRYPEAITDKYSEAQAAEVERQTALNRQETAKVEAETKKIEAQGEADANEILTQSLTPEVLQQQYIDAISGSGTVYVVPEGSTPLVSVTE